MHHISPMNFDLHFFGARFWCVRNDFKMCEVIGHIEPFAFSCFYTRMHEELTDFSIINIDILPESSGHNASRMLSKPKESSAGWFILGSLVTHLIIMAGFAQQHWSVPVDVTVLRGSLRIGGGQTLLVSTLLLFRSETKSLRSLLPHIGLLLFSR